MRIKKLKINSYGKLKEKEIELGDNINIIYGENESGKSTLLNFIVNCFYGISKNKKGREYSNFDKYMPWNGDEFSGKLEYVLEDGQKFEIYRDFKKKNPKIYNEQGEDISKNFNIDKSKGNEFFYEQTKVDEDLFLSTVVVNQQEVKLERAEQNIFVQKIANIVGTGEDNVSYKRAMDRINRKQLSEIGTQSSREKPINILQRNIEQQEKELEDLSKYEDIKYDIEENKNNIKKEIFEAENKLIILNNMKKQKEKERLEKEKIKLKENIKQENQNKIDDIIKKQKEIEQKLEEVKTNNTNKNTIRIHIIIGVILILLNIALLFVKIKPIIKIACISILFLYIIIVSIKSYLNNKQKKIEKKQEIKFRKNVELEITNLENEKKVLQSSNELIEKEIEEINSKMGLESNNTYENINSLENINEEIDKLQHEINSKNIKLHTLDLDKKNIEPKLDNLASIEEELTKNKEHKEKLYNLNESINIAKEVLNNAYEKMKKTVTPKFTNEMSKSIENITDGKYNNVRFNDEMGLIVELENGNYILANKLSVGTIDQLYLSLRLSMVEELSEEKMPIILDEVFAYFDDERLENILKYLSKRFHDRQIIIFTCTQREKEIFENLKIRVDLICLKEV